MTYLVIDSMGHVFGATFGLHAARVLAKGLSDEEENLHEPLHILERVGFDNVPAEFKGHGYYLDGEYHSGEARNV